MSFIPQNPEYYLLEYINKRFNASPQPPFYVTFCMTLLEYVPWVVVPLGVALVLHKIIWMHNCIRDVRNEEALMMRWYRRCTYRIFRVKKQNSRASMIPNVGSDSTIVKSMTVSGTPTLIKRRSGIPIPCRSGATI